MVSTSTGGEAPDRDGYLLTVDALDTLVLQATGTAEAEVEAGARRLRLLGVAEHCTVAPGASMEVDVAVRSRTTVSFAISCPATGVRLTMVTTGLDIAPNGYRIAVDAVELGRIPANGTTLIHLEPGERTIAVMGLASNCSLEGPPSRTVTVVDREAVPLAFAAVCAAATGVIGVFIGAVGVETAGEYAATLDGARYPAHPNQPTYLGGVSPGEHVVGIVPPANCSAQPDLQPVTVTAGGLARDTAEVNFSVSCSATHYGTLRVSARTTGVPPQHGYRVWVCDAGFYCRFYPYLLGAVDPNGTLVAQVPPGTYETWLDDVPGTCRASGPDLFAIEQGETLDLVYDVSCP